MADTLKLYKQIESKEEEIEKARKGAFKCLDQFRPTPFSERDQIDIPTATVDIIRRGGRKLFIISETDVKLGISNGTHQGYPLDDWWHDFKLRLVQLDLVNKLNELAELKKEVEEIMSVKEKKTVKAGKISDRLANL